MTQDWILDVLSDLRRFAASNDMPVLVEQLDDTIIVASAEIASGAGSAALGRDGKSVGDIHRAHAAGDNA